MNGVNGYKFYNKSDHSKFIFLPASGYYKETTMKNHGTNGYFWASDYRDNIGAYSMDFDSSSVITQNSRARYVGVPVRGIKKAPVPEGFVDLDLPSGTCWAEKNLGANSEEDYGYYFSWGNIVGHKSSNGSTFDDDYDFGTISSGQYGYTPGASVSANIASNDVDHDAAQAILGGRAHMPTNTQFQELYDNTDREWTSINGVNGYKFMKKSDHSVYVFFPAAGRGYGTSLRDSGSMGCYWSSTWHNSNYSYHMEFNSSSVYPQNNGSNRCFGFSVRAVV